MHLKCGTRKSLLAWSQSQWVAQEIEKLNPGLTIELIGIETKGDKILDIPLNKVEGKDFFVAELDKELQSKNVDFTVHSLKDLSLERPADLCCPAILKRQHPHDVLILNKYFKYNKKTCQSMRLGTSSPRRLENVPLFLEEISLKKEFIIWTQIRGNVTTRLKRIHEPFDSDRYLDGVVLALAGLVRLWDNPTANKELSELLKGVKWVIFPLAECPTAPGQGALAVECRKGDSRVVKILEKLDDFLTRQATERERRLLLSWGGGCQQKVGATTITIPDLGDVFWVRGVKPTGERIKKIEWKAPPLSLLNKNCIIPWDGIFWREKSAKNFYKKGCLEGVNFKNRPVFITHWRALAGLLSEVSFERFETARLWTSGMKSWTRLSQIGFWIEGCAEGFGFNFLSSLIQETVLQLPTINNWIILTHERGVQEWEQNACFREKPEVIATYSVNYELSHECREMLNRATHIFWSSGFQWDTLKNEVSKGVHHACGAGKTAQKLRASGLEPKIFPSRREWNKWIQEHK